MSTKYKDYKFWYINRDNNGFIDKAAVKFYEGQYKDIEIDDIEMKKVVVNRYIRLKNLKTEIYTDKDFGQIKTDDELRTFLNKQLDKVPGLKAIAKQKCHS